MFLTREELESLEKIGVGGFGTTYRREDKVLKVYKDEIVSADHKYIGNPMLKHRKLILSKLNRLMSLNSKLEYTDLVEDLLYIDDEFAGIILPYYEGTTFLKLQDIPIEQRIKYARLALRSARELNSHRIYPLDYTLKNIMVVNDEVKIIDLDDTCTKVLLFKNPYFYALSVEGLDKTIKEFFNEHTSGYYKSVFGKEVYKRLGKPKYQVSKTFDDIESYIDDKSIKKKLLFINQDFDMMDDNLLDNSTIILVSNILDPESILDILYKLERRGITVYDIVRLYKVEEYINNTSHLECLAVRSNKVLTLK